MGSAKYAEHPSTEIWCLGYAFNSDDPGIWILGDDPPQDLFDAAKEKFQFHAWNSAFEMRIWQKLCVERMGWDPIPFNRWRDPSAIAASFSLPLKLEECGIALKLKIQKDQRGKYLIRKLCKPRIPSKNNPATRWTPETAPQDFEDLYSYCKQDVRSEREVLVNLPRQHLTKQETKTWRETMRMNDRGFPIDVKSVRRMSKMLTKSEGPALQEFQALTAGFVKTPGQIKKLLVWLRGEGLVLPNLQAPTVEAAIAKKGTTKKAKRALQLRQELSKTSVKKYKAISSRICNDLTVKDNLVYHGAGTGRYAGRGFQVQNLPRDSISKSQPAIEKALKALDSDDPVDLISLIYGSPSQYASHLIRPMIMAPDGQILYGADLSSIENRVTVWYAEDPYGTKIFQDGLDQYKMFAVDFYQIDYDDVDETQRAHSKQIILGCCFGMAARTFVRTCAQHGQIITLKEAQKSVDEYRAQYSEVVRLWSGLNKAAMKAVIFPGTTTRYKRVRFHVADNFLYMKLASGRSIAYYSPKVMHMPTPWGEKRPTVTHMGMNQKTHQWIRMSISPGRFTENLVQGTACDIMVHGQEKVSEAGYELIGCVHDETISLTDESFGSVEEYERLTTTVPKWWGDQIPLEAEAWSGKRYRK